MKTKHFLTACVLFMAMNGSLFAQDQPVAKPAPTPAQTSKFFEENAAKPGITITASGLQYKIIKKGTGAVPSSTDKVTLYYGMSMINGTPLWKPFDVKNPWIHHIDKAVPGIREALSLMPVGSKWVLYIPSELGLGDQAFDVLPANSAIVCELELVAINPGE